MDHFVLERFDCFQTITMNWTADRPGFRPDSFDAVSTAIRSVESDTQIACTVFFGVPRCFCLGTDVTSFADPTQLDQLSAIVLKFFRTLINTRKPLIAAVDGPAVGLGMTMLGHFDAVFATPESVFKAPFVDWGLSPEAASSLLLPETVGYRKAFELFCLGGQMSAEEARQAGVITQVVARDHLADVARDAARHLGKAPRRALATTRELLRHDRNKMIKRARTETSAFQELLGEDATQRRLKAMARATRMALSA